MWAVLLLASLVTIAAATPQYYSSRGSSSNGLLNLFGNGDGGSRCDPATGAGCGDANNIVGTTSSGGGSSYCPQDRVVTVPRVSTQVQQVVRTIEVPQVNTQVFTQTSLVPSFTTNTVVNTDIETRVDYRTRVETNVNTQEVVRTSQLPDTFSTRIEVVYRTDVDTQYNTRTQYVTRQDVRTSVSVVDTQRQVPTVLRVPQVQVSTNVVQVPGPAQTQVRTVYNTREVVSYYRLPASTVVRTSISYRVRVTSLPQFWPSRLRTLLCYANSPA